MEFILYLELEGLVDLTNLNKYKEDYKNCLCLAALTEKSLFMPLTKEENASKQELESKLQNPFYDPKKKKIMSIRKKFEIASLESLLSIYNWLCQESHNNLNAVQQLHIWEDHGTKSLIVGTRIDDKFYEFINFSTIISSLLLIHTMLEIKMISNYDAVDVS